MDKQFVIPALPILVPLAVVLVLAATLVLLLRRSATISRLLIAWAICLYVVGVISVTILPLYVSLGVYADHVPWYDKTNVIPNTLFVHPRHFALNVVMTLPLGVLLPRITHIRGTKHLAVLALGFSGVIELVQFVTAVVASSCRTADVNDLIANTLGAVIGYLAFKRIADIPPVESTSHRSR